MSGAAVPGGGRYAAVILYELTCPSTDFETVYEETVTVLRAESPEQAWEAARRFGKTLEGSYRNEYGETLTNSVKRIVDVAAINDDLDGDAEVYTRYFRDYAAYRAIQPRSGEGEHPDGTAEGPATNAGGRSSA
jgi:hypothetical protein